MRDSGAAIAILVQADSKKESTRAREVKMRIAGGETMRIDLREAV